MKIILLITVLAAAADAKAATPGGCRVSDWSPWHILPDPELTDPGLSFPDNGEETGRGRINRLKMMELKEEHSESVRRCQREGNCDVMYRPRQSEGRVDCVNNWANDLDCDHIDQLSFINITDMTFDPNIDPNANCNDLWGWVDPQDDREYAIMGMTGGTSFVDVTDPENPRALGHLRTRGTAGTLWRDIKVIKNYAYIVSELAEHGVQVFNLERLRDVTNGPVMFTEDGHYSGVGNCHNIVANEQSGFLYAVGCTYGDHTLCGGGLHVLDTNPDPVQLTYAGCFGADGYTHDAQCVMYSGPDSRYTGREICFAYNEEDLTIVDVTDKNDMVMISKRSYIDNEYSHQGWLSEDQSLALSDDELDEIYTVNKFTRTLIWNLFDLEQPYLAREYRAAFESIDHNQYVKGEYVFQSNYLAGMRMLWLDQVNMDLREVAYFDNIPGINIANFAGTWSVYPYFPSGNIIVTSTSHGLFTVRPRYSDIAEIVDNLKQSSVRMSRYRTILGAEDEQFCPELTQTKYQ